MTALAALLVTGAPVSSQDSTATHPDTAYAPGGYRVFTGAGEPASLQDIVTAMGRHDVVFIGETHDDPTGHMLELRLLEGGWERSGNARPLALSLEFFQHDVQPILDEYLEGLITEKSFLDDSRPWPRYETDYRPLVELARERGLDVIAANAPRRYVNRVSRLGRESLEQLSAEALESLPPLPYAEPSRAYRNQWIQAISEVMEQEGMKCGEPSDSAPAPTGAHEAMGNQLDSQVLWDATMAWWISRYLESHPDALVLHMVGGFHVARSTGIPEHLEVYAPDASYMIVMLRPVEDVDTFEPAPEGRWGDFVIQTEGARTLEAIECRGRTP